MRVLHFVTVLDDENSLGGPVTVAIAQCRELRRRGHDARLCGGWGGAGAPPTEIDGVPAHLFRAFPLVPGLRFSGLVAPGLVRWLVRARKHVDVAHVHLARDLIPLAVTLQLRRAGVPFVVQTHGMVLPDHRVMARAIDLLATGQALTAAAARLVLTDDERRALTELTEGRVELTYLPNGIEVPAEPVGPGPDDPLDVLFMARLHPRKRVLDFAGAAATLAAEGVNARFSVVGPDDGDLENLERFLAAYPHVRDRLVYEGPLGHEAAMRRLMACTIYVLPSVDEPFPMTMLEALARSRPSVCTTGCGIADLLAGRHAARVVEPGAEPLAGALRSLLADRRERAALGSAGREAAESAFSLQVVGEALDVIYADTRRRTEDR